MLASTRPARSEDIPEIIELVRAVVFETYDYLITKNGEPPQGDPARWAKALIAELDGSIIGVGLAVDDFISDLWLKRDHRGRGVGAALLIVLEQQIANNKHETARLRVVEQNVRARKFYSSHGWREVKTYPHERDGHLMVDMRKHL